MLQELFAYLSQPLVWIKLAAISLMALAVFRLGIGIIIILSGYTNKRFTTIMKALWIICILFISISIACYSTDLKYFSILHEFGKYFIDGMMQSLAKIIILSALALVAWDLINTLSNHIVPSDDFNRRNIRIQTLKGVIESSLKVAIIIILLITILQVLGINTTGLLAGVSILGIAVGFGAQSLVKDVFTGFFILLEDQYGIGDIVAINSSQLSGTVEGLNLRCTSLRSLDGTLHIIPNGQINTVSVSSKGWSRVVASVVIPNTADLNKALQILDKVSTDLTNDPAWSEFFLDTPDIQGVTQLANDGTTIRALFKVKPKSQDAISREFNKRIKLANEVLKIKA